MTEYILSVVSSVTVSGLFAAALIFLSKSWMSQRIKSSIEHEYAEKLEGFKAQLKAEHDTALEKIKASNAQNLAIQSAATASLAATHTAAQEKKFHSLEVLWKAAVQLRKESPTVLAFLNIHTASEYNLLLLDSHKSLTIDLTLDDFVKNFGEFPDAEMARLYVGEYMYSLFWAYRAIIGRIVFIIMAGVQKDTIQDWAQDTGIRQLIKHVLTDAEIQEFDNQSIGRINWLCNQIEQKILVHSAKIISGEASATFGLEQAHKIAHEATRLQKDMEDAQANISSNA